MTHYSELYNDRCLYCSARLGLRKWHPYCSEYCKEMSYDYQPDIHRALEALEDKRTDESLKELAQFAKDRES